MAIVLRILMFLAIVYIGVAAIIYFRQDNFVFPAPQEGHEPAPGYAAVVLKTEDGLALSAHWRAPNEGKPTIVHFHGNSGSLLGATSENQLFADEGFGVLLVEYRGYGGNPGAPSEVGFHKDGRAAMAFLEKQEIPVGRTILKGHSIGSATATQMAGEFDVSALILVAPFTSIADRMAEALPIFPMRMLLRNEFNNLDTVSTLQVPILVQHGTQDAVIPDSHGKALAEAAPASTFQSYPGEEHDLTFNPKVQAAQLEWLTALGQ